ncbi:MAG: hypothetical protein GX464_05480 [Holophagae bacterium]|nr:hypothetical protein [Holophagae bacterium]
MTVRNGLLLIALAGATTQATLGRTQPISDLDAVRQLLEARAAGGVQAPSEVVGVSLAGYNFHRLVEPGQGLRVVVISCTQGEGGGLLAFDRGGKLIAKRETGEIISIQLVDLDHDGVDELITEEVVNCSTGNFNTLFGVYRVSGGTIKQLWTKEAAWDDHVPPSPHERRQCFLRAAVTARGCVVLPQLVYVVLDPSSCSWGKETWQLNGDSFQQTKNAP